MPLYEVTITAYVRAKNYAEAKAFVEYGDLGHDLALCDVDVYETHTVNAHWADLIPFSPDEDDDERTCMQILKGEST